MKRLLCFFDGTWNRPDDKGGVTNVVKLHAAVPPVAPDGTRQIAHYEIGIATGNLGRLTFAAGAVGYGVGDRIQSGYKFLVETYEPGDEIYLFGFSRGAFQARSTAGLVARYGILRADQTRLIPELWGQYQLSKAAADPEVLARLRAAAHPATRIRLVGVWDTVGNLGLPLVSRNRINRALAFHDTELSPSVDVGLHALAIDEPRGVFSPTLWTRRRGAAPTPGQIVEQVWFPGCHANVGGGYRDSALSDISLLWMAERAMATTGVAFDLDRLGRQAQPDPLGEEVSPTSDTFYKVSRALPFVRLIEQRKAGVAPWRRALVGCWRSSLLAAGLETVNESIHASAVTRLGRRVKQRIGEEVSEITYRPRALRTALKRKA